LDLSRTEQTLALLYSEAGAAIPAEDLAAWVEAPRMSDFRKDVLKPLHRKRLIEFDVETNTALLSPTGVPAAEEILGR
jgi:hypothetical protein